MPDFHDDELEQIMELSGSVREALDMLELLDAQEAAYYLPRTLKDFREMLKNTLTEKSRRIREAVPLDEGEVMGVAVAKFVG